MSETNKNWSGFTLIEMLAVMGVALIFISMSVGVYFSFQDRTRIDLESQGVLSALRLAQNITLAAENFDSHGIHFDTSANTYTLFEGSTFDPLDTANELFNLENRIIFSNIQLTGGGDNVIFDRVSGTTAHGGFVEMIDAGDTTIIRVICIESEGSVRVLRLSEISSDCTSGVLEYNDGTTAANLASFPNNFGFGDPAQSFTVGAESIFAHRVDLYLMQTTTPSNIFLEIRSATTTGPVIAKSIVVDGASVPGALSWIQFIFPSAVELSASTEYFLRLRSLPDSTIAFSGAAGTVYWGYEHSSTEPPAYGGGDAWRYVGASDNPADEGQQLGPVDQYDFSFRIFSQDGPTVTDSRHLEFDIGASIRGNTSITLTFAGSTAEVVTIADYMNVSETIFDWSGTVDVSGSPQTIRMHSLFIDDDDTIVSVHRDRRQNDASLVIDIDGTDLVSYTAEGSATKGASIDSMVYR